MKVHLVDGTFELFRAHFAKRPPHAGPKGRDLKATVGVVQSLLWLLEDPEEQVTHLAVAFDNPIVSFRNALFDGYKSDAGMDPVLRSQFDDVEEAVRATGITVWSMNEFEADDALATAAARFAEDPRVAQVRILTPDKDLGQCLRGEKVVQVDRIRKKVITEASHRADKNLAPASVPDFLGLVGDTADGIPGLEGWGEKGASAVLAVHPTIEEIPDSSANWKAKPAAAVKMAAVLQRERANALLYKKLATLRTDVPLKESLDDLEFKGCPRDAFTAWAKSVLADSLPGRVKRWRE